MKKCNVLLIVMLILGLTIPAQAIKLTVNSTDEGQFHDLKVTGANLSAVAGGEATIDLTTLSQLSATGAAAVLTLSQTDISEPLMDFVGTANTVGAGTGISMSTSANTAGSKVGSIQIDFNGTERYIRVFDAAN